MPEKVSLVGIEGTDVEGFFLSAEKYNHLLGQIKNLEYLVREFKDIGEPTRRFLWDMYSDSGEDYDDPVKPLWLGMEHVLDQIREYEQKPRP